MINLTNIEILKLKLGNNSIDDMGFVNNLDKLINLVDLEIDIKNSELGNERGIEIADNISNLVNLTKLILNLENN